MSDAVDKLGAWEDRPQRVLGVDITSAPIDSKAAFVLTRIDGLATVTDLCAMSGLGQRETLEMLLQLIESGLITVEAAEGERRMVRLSQRTRTKPPSTAPERTAVADFHGVSPADVAVLEKYGAVGRVPGRPFRQPGEGRYGQFEFDRRRLLQPSALTLDQKREILFLSELMEQLDHFEFFGVEPTADRKAIKKAYFEFSKRFHPDTVFRKEVGEFRPVIERIFKYGTEVYEALTRDETLRETYARAVKARDDSHRSVLEADRDAREEARRQRELAVAATRKDGLRERLAQNTRTRRENAPNNAVVERIDKAQQFYDEGMEHYKGERFITAANSLRLALTYDPKNQSYRAAYEKVKERADHMRAEQHWKRGYLQESVGRVREALACYLEAIEAWPRHDYCAHVAEMLYDNAGDLHRAAQMAAVAVEGEPQNVDYLLLLGRIYAKADLTKKAISVLERVQAIDPKHDAAKQLLKTLKRK
ncbi:MAG: DnaJ domain-containing protein [Myxococcales bacterium]|nr:DnaJ domain-containing protein [Myxococcales bacterium]